jgi:membrane-associated protease RseP (regulator of RpoE activity)
MVLVAVGMLVSRKVFPQTDQKVNPPQSRLGIYGVMGFVITEVDPNSTAAQAGLKPGDIVTGLNGQLTGIREFQGAIWSSPPETTLSIEYLRLNPATGKTEENKVTVKTMAFTANAQSNHVRVSTTKASHGLVACPEGCCESCQGSVPEKYCILRQYFTGFRNCRSDGFSCKGLYCA